MLPVGSLEDNPPDLDFVQVGMSLVDPSQPFGIKNLADFAVRNDSPD